MRASAILIGALALLLSSCGVEPQIRTNTKDELAKVKGPDPSGMDATLTAQAQAAAAQGNYRDAAQDYKQLLDRSPGTKAYQLGYAENLRRMGDCVDALHVLDDVAKTDAANPDALENKGLCLMNTGEFDEAAGAFGQVMKVDSKRWRTLNGIGILFAMRGKYDDAVAYFQQALNSSTDNPSVLNNAALTYAIDRQFDRSYDTFARAKRHVQSTSADMKRLDMNLALVYAVDGKLDDAERTAAPYLSREALYNNMGFYSYLAKNNELAKGYLNMALTQSPTYYERAWKNLSAMNGDPGTTGSQISPMPQATLPAASVALPAPATASQGGMTLDEIPPSKPQASTTNPDVVLTRKTPVTSSGQ